MNVRALGGVFPWHARRDVADDGGLDLGCELGNPPGSL